MKPGEPSRESGNTELQSSKKIPGHRKQNRSEDLEEKIRKTNQKTRMQLSV